MDHPRTGLRYVDADELDNSTLDFDGMKVESPAGDSLGDVDGFIIDINAARPHYVVVNAGGWFTSKFFLLPIGHVALDAVHRKLVTDVSKDHVKKYPGFDRDEFEKLSEADLEQLYPYSVAAATPDWWDSSFYRPDRADRTAQTIASTAPMARTMDSTEHVVARGEDAGDVSPHVGRRAQPGDVLGLETGGEETHVGETSEDENTRRRDAQDAAGKGRVIDRDR